MTPKRLAFVCCALLPLIGIALAIIHIHSTWLPKMRPVEKELPYTISPRRSDSLRIVMIGDSWAGIHNAGGYDIQLQKMIAAETGEKVSFKSSGLGGAKSGDIYKLMFGHATYDGDKKYSTRSLLAAHPDYCIVSAGINDAAANIGYDTYHHNLSLIVDWLIKCDITPVIIEIPDVNLQLLYSGKPVYDKFTDWLRSCIAHCDMYNVSGYRLVQQKMMEQDRSTAGKIVYIDKDKWNRDGYRDTEQLYSDEQIHLNSYGYRKLDSCIATMVAADVKRRRQQNIQQ